MKTLVRAAILSSLLALAAASAHALDTYSSLGPSGAYKPNNAYVVSGPLSFRFVATATGALSGFSGALNDSGVPVSYALRFYADGPSTTRGALIASTTGSTTGAVYGTTDSALASAAIAGGPSIVANSAYWVEVAPRYGIMWNISIVGTTGRSFSNDAYFDGQPTPAFSVQVNPVPEPATIAALGLGAVVMLRRRHKA